MTSAEIRRSFLDFFKSKAHTLVPSASLLPDSPNLLFTNAGMNQFVPIFLGQRAPDVSQWPGAVPGSDTRAADTQKVIRAGGKHNDLEDVGLDTYHHTFFEMLGNWSFGDYFKKEAIEWAWELLTEVYNFPKERLYATVYSPDKSQGDPSDFDQEAYDFWAAIFRAAGLEPKTHIVHGNKKDNFWMMGETGPCGPCSEIHFDLTAKGDTKGALVNKGDPLTIEIWNLVFIQFNANPDGTFSPLPARHVDTGMGFERLTSFLQCTRNFTDFNRVISNYETDIFRPLFDKIEKLSGRKYGSTLPAAGRAAFTEQEKNDVAFRVLADHIRTLSFAIGDGIEPGNKERNGVLRRILRRAAMFGRSLGFHEPFLYKLVTVVVDRMGDVFPEVRARRDHIEQVIQREEEAFNKTLDTGLTLFDQIATAHKQYQKAFSSMSATLSTLKGALSKVGTDEFEEPVQTCLELAAALDEAAVPLRVERDLGLLPADFRTLSLAPAEILNATSSLQSEPIDSRAQRERIGAQVQKEVMRFEKAAGNPAISGSSFSGESAFLLSATYGFPVEETERLARDRGLILQKQEYKAESQKHQVLSRAGQIKEVIELSEVANLQPTQFVGYDTLEASARVLEVVAVKDRTAVILDSSPFYAEMGGQVGDTGELSHGGQLWQIFNTQKAGNAWLHFLDQNDGTRNTEHESRSTTSSDPPSPESVVSAVVDRPRRNAIQRHHTVTHLLHWALHEIVSKDAVQKGSYVGPDKLTFDFSSAPLSPSQVADVEKLVNERILENAPITWKEFKYSDVKDRKDIMQFFGEKYGDQVRVVQIGGRPAALDGYSMELCGGTHTRATGELGMFRIVGESAIAAGIRRIEAVSGLEAYKRAQHELQLIKQISGKINSPVGELENKIEALLTQQKELEKQLKAVQQKQAAETARSLVARAQALGSTRAILENVGAGDGDFLQAIADALKGQFKGVVVLAASNNGAVALVTTVSPELTKQFQAGKLLQQFAPVVGGKGGGRPDNARGGGKDVTKIEEALAQARKLIEG